MPALSAAAELHEQPHEAAQRALSHAAQVIMFIADGAGDGQHELRIHVPQPEGDLEYALPYSRCGKVIAFPDDGGEHMAVVLLATASLAERAGTMTLRSRTLPAFFPSRRKPSSPSSDQSPPESVLRGWRLGGLLPQPMSEGQLFASTCTSPAGEPIPPEPGTRFRAAFPLDARTSGEPAT
jgi:hypothetical protein